MMGNRLQWLFIVAAIIGGIAPLTPAFQVARQFDQLSDATLMAAIVKQLFAITIEGEAAFDGDLDAVVELDALEPGQADVIQWVVPNRLLVADGFQALNDVAVDFILTVVHGAKGKTPVVFVHNVSMRMISARPVPPEINVQFRTV